MSGHILRRAEAPESLSLIEEKLGVLAIQSETFRLA